MIQKKICMLGSFAVGKTSLVSRFVRSIFSDKYHTTIGVKVDKKVVETPSGPLTIILWDIYGDDDFQSVRPSFLRGSAGYFLVADGTRRVTLDRIPALHKVATDSIGKAPFIILLNKSDLQSEWEIDEREEKSLAELGPVIQTSAKTGEGVEEAFAQLTAQLLRNR